MNERGTKAALLLLGDVLRGGLTKEASGRLREAGITLPPPSAEGWGSADSPDEEAARHQHLFGHAVPPYSGVFMSPDGRIGGSGEGVLMGALMAQGIRPEHIGVTAADVSGIAVSVAHLLEREGGLEAVAPLTAGMAMGWLPALELALVREGGEDYAAVTGLLSEILVALVPQAMARSIAAKAAGSMEDEPPPLDAKRTGVREIATYLSTHALTGFYLGRGTVGRLGRALGVPRGFGSSDLMLSNLLKAAAGFGKLAAGLELLQAEVALYQDHWKQRSAEHPALEPWAVMWVKRLTRTSKLLATVEASVHSEEASSQLS